MPRVLAIDPSTFDRAFATRSMAVRHELADHPLFGLDAIGRLADRLPADQVRRERSDLPLDDRGYVDVGAGLASATVTGIEHNGYRVSLREIQDDPEYGPLIAQGHAEVAALLGNREGGVFRPAGYIFVTAPGGNTPMHFDGEHSLLLQVRGTKTVHTVPRNASTQVQRELDRYYDDEPCAFDEMRAAADTIELGPGDGVYFPSFLPHWVENGPEASVSISLPFYTHFSRQAEDVNRINKRLRRFGLSPRPPGASHTGDAVKAALIRSLRALKAPVEQRRSRTPA